MRYVLTSIIGIISIFIGIYTFNVKILPGWGFHETGEYSKYFSFVFVFFGIYILYTVYSSYKKEK